MATSNSCGGVQPKKMYANLVKHGRNGHSNAQSTNHLLNSVKVKTPQPKGLAKVKRGHDENSKSMLQSSRDTPILAMVSQRHSKHSVEGKRSQFQKSMARSSK